MSVGDPGEAILVLEDGTVFHGRSFGAVGQTFGEAVFSTGMTGYQETLTDPSYDRQVVIATAPHIGNTGWNDEDDESGRIWVAGYVVRDPSPRPSSWRATRTLADELRAQGVVGVCGIDTRALTRHLREAGAMRVGLSSTDVRTEALLERVLASPSMVGANLVDEVSTPAPHVVPAQEWPRFRVAAIDLGIKRATLRALSVRGVEVHVLPAASTFEDVMATRPDGVFFSNGPGDPAACAGPIALCRRLLDAGLPFFGICLGNQIFGLALGLTTYKLKFGHRGINQPVRDEATGRVDITAHNHGFAVRAPLGETVTTEYGDVTVSHRCLNDDCVEGLRLTRDGRLAGFSVQYHPEAAAGPHDAEHLFDEFIDLMESPTPARGC
jgi:carbamoyl-phosphate synthase small subunit